MARPGDLLVPVELVERVLAGSWDEADLFAPTLDSAGVRWTSGTRQLWQEVYVYDQAADAEAAYPRLSPTRNPDYVGLLEELPFEVETTADEMLYACGIPVSTGCAEWVAWLRLDAVLVKLVYSPAQGTQEREFRTLVETVARSVAEFAVGGPGS